ncbi:hypothetical protein G9A89_013951 [Geosiphon pyriformis]|nr:hypothetical protein G9A89_013951 [Geosiphon pyriformis]
MLRTIPYFLKGTAEEWFENLATPFNDWDTFKAAFLEQFTNNNTSITLRNWFCNIKQESSKSVITYLKNYLTIPEEQDFYHTALSEGRAAAQQQNPSYTPTTIPPARIAENANLSNIFPFEFEANKSPFLLSNAAANEQKAITAMYTETETIIVTADGIKKTPVGKIDNFPFTINGITIPVKVLVIDASQYQALIGNDWLQKANANLNWKTQELTISYQEQHARVPATCGTFNKYSKKALAFEFEPEEEKPIIKIFMALGSTSNWADETEQHALNKLYHYPHDTEMIFDLAMTLVNKATKKDVYQMKEAEYIEYTMELAGFNYKNEVEVYHQIVNHTYLTQEAQIQQLEQMNIRLCEECIMPCDEQWCPNCYALSIPLFSENDENKIEFEEPEATEEIKATPIYLIENQSALQLKYFNNNRQGIKPEKAHKIDAGYDLRYPGKNTLVLKPKSLTKINLKIALKILPGAMIQITFWFSLASKEINVRKKIIDAEYTGDITVILQNETNKLFKIKHAEKIAQAIYLPLINISEIGVIHSNIFQQELLQTVPNFLEIIEHSLPKINPNFSSENYHVVIEKLSQINIEQLKPQQQNQLKELIAEFANIFAKNNNDLGRTDLV